MKVAQLCLTPCDPMDYIVHGILQARILKWVDIPFFKGSLSGIEPRSPVLQAVSLPAEPLGKPNIDHNNRLHLCSPLLLYKLFTYLTIYKVIGICKIA